MRGWVVSPPRYGVGLEGKGGKCRPFFVPAHVEHYARPSVVRAFLHYRRYAIRVVHCGADRADPRPR